VGFSAVRRNVSTRLRGLWIPLVASCLVATGCSAVKLGYDNLPMLAMWRVDSYLSLDSEQRALAERRIETLHAWHRRTQLDDYVSLLQSIQRRVADGEPVSEADIRGWRIEVLERWRPIAQQAAPAVAEVAFRLEPRQLAQMRAEFARDNEKARREWMPGDERARLEARVKRYVSRGETFLGSLSDAQKQAVRRIAAEAPATEALWLSRRAERQQDLIATMARIRDERPSEAVATGWMQAHLLRYAELRDEPGREGTPSALALGDAISATLLATATPKQRQHLQRTLQGWIDLLQSLRPQQTARAVQGGQALVAQP